MLQSEIFFGKGYQDFFTKNFFSYAENDVKYDDAKSFYDLGEFYRGNSDLKKADFYYQKAFSVFEQYSEKKYFEAYYYLGYFYQYGFGVEKNIKQAEKFYQLAFTELSKYKSNPEYYYLMGRIYESGFSENKFGDVNYDKASQYYSLAAELNYTDAFYRLGYIDAIRKNKFN